MNENYDIITRKIFLDARPSANFSNGYGIFQPSTKTLSTVPEQDFYITVPLKQSNEIHEYVDTQKDDTIEPIQRQEINPFFLEYKFFDNIERNKVNIGEDLSFTQVNYIKSVRPELANFSEDQVRVWFDAQGKNELPWDTANGQVTIYDIEAVQPNLLNITSKADFLNITVNR